MSATAELPRLQALMRSGQHRAALLGLLDYRARLPGQHALHESIQFNIWLCLRELAGSAAATGEGDFLRVGILAPHDRTKGLYRDVETVVWALCSRVDLLPSVLEVPGNLYKFRYDADGRQVCRTSEGSMTVARWIDSVDAIVAFEAIGPALVRVARARGVPVLYVPNLEWSTLDPASDDVRPWEALLRDAADCVTTVARTRSIELTLRERGIPCVRIDWSIPDPVVERRPRVLAAGEPLRVLFNAGNFGFKERRGTDVLLESLPLLATRKRPMELLIKGNKPREELAQLPEVPGLTLRVDTRFLPDRHAMLRLYDEADVVVYPSRFEGLGLGLLEALHRGCFVLATDGEPMNELLPPEFPRIASAVSGRLRHAYTYEPSAQSLAAGLNRLLEDPARVLPVDARRYGARQDGFCHQLQALCTLLGSHRQERRA